jgi:uncharacterized protein YbaP (TraB family)
MSRLRALAAADHAALLSLKLLAAANMLFLVIFMILCVMAAGRAHAATPACTGSDLLATLEKNDPALLERIRREAAATKNGEGLLWKIERGVEAPSFLFGTMHMTDPRVTGLTQAAMHALEASGTLVIETTDVLDEARMMAALAAEPELMMFTDGTTLASLLSPGDAAIVASALEERGIPEDSVSRMKPWMLSGMVALPACEMARKAGGAPVLDVMLARQASAGGKDVEGLETIADQLRAMASLPMEFHIKGLVETLKLGERLNDVIETMIVLYEREATGMFWPLLRAVLPEGSGDAIGYAAFEEALITGRNRTMADGAEPLLRRGNAFIAVGALHLPGPEGLIELLRAAGYRVSRVR